MGIIQRLLWGYKRCSTCGIEKPTTEFPTNRNKPDGLQSRCRVCQNEASKDYYARHRDERLRYQNDYNEQNKEALSVRRKRYRKETNYNGRYRENWQAWCATRRARKKAGGRFSAAEWHALKQACEHRCLRCGRQEPGIRLQPDHVLPLSQGGANTIDNIQPLCKACNLWKASKHIDFR